MRFTYDYLSYFHCYSYMKRRGIGYDKDFFPGEYERVKKIRDSIEDSFSNGNSDKKTLVERFPAAFFFVFSVYENEAKKVLSASSLANKITRFGNLKGLSVTKRNKKKLIRVVEQSKAILIQSSLLKFESNRREGNVRLELEPYEWDGKRYFNVKNKIFSLSSRISVEELRHRYKIKPANRTAIMSSISQLLSQKMDIAYLRTDVKSFFESIDFERVIEKLKDDGRINVSTIKAFEDIKAECERLSCNSLPRGLGVSSYLSEYYMLEFDELISSRSDVLYYARYVDDIFILAFIDDDSDYTKEIMAEMKSQSRTLGLELHEDEKFREGKLLTAEKSFSDSIDYLGYHITFGSNHKPSFDISDNKVERIKGKVEAVFNRYFKTMRTTEDKKTRRKAVSLLVDSLKFLTGKTFLLGLKRNVIVGVPVNYPLVDVKTSSQVKELDKYLANKKEYLPDFLQKNVEDLTFRNGFVTDRIYHFSSNRLRMILGKYEAKENI